MKNIRLATSMIFDFICIPTQLEYFEYNAFRFTPEQKSALEKIKELLDEELNKSPYSFSTLCDIVAVYLPSPETATLDELYNMFLNMDDVEKVCREKITNEFTLSYTLPLVQQIKNGGDKIIRKQIRAFQRIGFEELWREYILPHEEAHIQRLEDAYRNTNTDEIFRIINALKAHPVKDPTVYISLMSNPISFTLPDIGFVHAVFYDPREYNGGFLSNIAHELIHGFSSNKVTKYYSDFVGSTPYLSATHRYLIEDMHSGNEEEHTMAAEYYTMWKSGAMAKEHILNSGLRRYGGCVPLSLYLFGKMTEEDGEIADYNSWLEGKYSCGTFDANEVPHYIDTMLPTPQTDKQAMDQIIARLTRISFFVRGEENTASDAFVERICARLNGSFVPNPATALNFGNSIALPCDMRRQILVSDGITVEAVAYDSIEDALSFDFERVGAKVETPRHHDGKDYPLAHSYAFIFKNGSPMRVELTFVLNTTRFFITSVVDPQPVKDNIDLTALVIPQWSEVLDAFDRIDRLF